MRVAIKAIINSVLPREISLLANGVIIARYIVIIIKIENCISVVRLVS